MADEAMRGPDESEDHGVYAVEPAKIGRPMFLQELADESAAKK